MTNDDQTDQSARSNISSNVGQTAVEPNENEEKPFLPPPGDHSWIDQFGTRHKRFIIEVRSAVASTAAALAETPDRQAAVLALDPLLRKLSDRILHVIVAGVEPAGPHLGNPDFKEDFLKELCRSEQEGRKIERLEKEKKNARYWSLGEKILLAVFTFALGLLAGWLL